MTFLLHHFFDYESPVFSKSHLSRLQSYQTQRSSGCDLQEPET